MSEQPINLDHIKRLAKKVKREQGLTHTQALESIVKSVGYHNYKHYLNSLK